jgi:hypothetical protein
MTICSVSSTARSLNTCIVWLRVSDYTTVLYLGIVCEDDEDPVLLVEHPLDLAVQDHVAQLHLNLR